LQFLMLWNAASPYMCSIDGIIEWRRARRGRKGWGGPSYLDGPHPFAPVWRHFQVQRRQANRTTESSGCQSGCSARQQRPLYMKCAWIRAGAGAAGPCGAPSLGQSPRWIGRWRCRFAQVRGTTMPACFPLRVWDTIRPPSIDRSQMGPRESRGRSRYGLRVWRLWACWDRAGARASHEPCPYPVESARAGAAIMLGGLVPRAAPRKSIGESPPTPLETPLERPPSKQASRQPVHRSEAT
jgi:hypothetical protein